MGPEFLRKLVIGLGLIYPPTAFFAKLSLFLLYLHIFSPNRPTRYMIYSGIAITFGLYTATFAYNVYLCVPRPGQGWLVAVSSPRCNKAYILSYIQGPFGIVSDFYLLLLPVPVVWQLHLPAKRKIGVCAIFATGFLACFSSVLGLYYRVRVVRSTDFSWQMLPVITLVIVEINVGVICSCMPHLASFFRHHHTYLTFFRSLTSRLFSSIKSSKRSFFSSHKSSPDESFDHVDARPSSDQSPYLETQILKSSARGDGRFLESGEFPLPPGQSHYRWSGGAPEPPEMRQGEPTYRDIWDRRV
ncbi:hypothetical protein MMC16_005675 [Acarospora aff. strigata]|nr:hypothetical protein [Acarospora aff. strigata]